MEPTLDSLLTHYAERIGGPFPLSLLPPDRPLHWQGQTLFGTAQTLEPPDQFQYTVDAFLSEAPLGTFSVGFWGHGMHSGAFHYQRREPWGSLFLRLPYGGFFEDNERAARRIKATMVWFARFLPILSERTHHFTAVDSMGDGLYRIVLTDGRVIEGDSPLFEPGRGPVEALRPLLETP